MDLTKGETFGFLGFTIRRVLSRRGKWWIKLLSCGVGRNVATLFGLSIPVMKAARSLRR